MALVNRK